MESKNLHDIVRKELIKDFEDLISDVYNNPKFDKKRTEEFTNIFMLIESELEKLKSEVKE